MQIADGSFHKSLKTLFYIGQKHSHCLANYSNTVVIGYPGRKLPWKLLTIVYKGKPLPESPLVCSCLRSSLTCYGGRQGNFNYTLWFEAIFRKEDCSQYAVGLVFKEIGSYSDQDKFRFKAIEDV